MNRLIITIFNKYRYTLLMIVITAIFLVQMYISLQGEANHLDEYIELNKNNINQLINVSIMNKGKVTNTLFNLYIDEETESIMNKFQSANQSEQDALRLQLLEKYLPVYEKIKSLGLRQFHFHASDGSSLLRLHKPAMYGDSIISYRDTVKAVFETHSFVQGFEQGLISNGYRYNYPIFYNDEYVGSVELSYDLKSVINPVLETYGLDAVLIMDKSEVDRKTSNVQASNYSDDSIFNVGYMDNAFPPDNIQSNMNISDENFALLNEQIKYSVLKEHHKDGDFTYVLADDELYWASTYDVYSYNETKIGTLVLYKNDSVLYDMVIHLKDSRIYITTTTILMFILLFISYFFFIRTNRQAIFDSLTTLHNRYYYTNIVEGGNIEGALLIIDIDDFKLVNDDYGHDKGDMVLKEIASILKASTRSTDIAMRWGGEEFMMIMNGMALEDSLNKAKGILKTIESHDFDGIKITVSIGIAGLGNNKERAIKEADQALYQVKKTGKNNAMIFTKEMTYE